MGRIFRRLEFVCNFVDGGAHCRVCVGHSSRLVRTQESYQCLLAAPSAKVR